MKRLKLKPPTWPQLLAMEQNPNIPIAQKALAALHLDFCMGPDREFWSSLKKLKQLDLTPVGNIAAYLEMIAATKLSPKNRQLVGDLAVQAGVLDQMPKDFLRAFVPQMSNCVQAIKVANELSLGAPVVVPLYIRMGLLHKAEDLASDDDAMIMLLVEEYAKRKNAEQVQRCVSLLQNPSDTAITAILRCYNIPLDFAGIKHEKQPRLDASDKRMVTAINKLLVLHPSILCDEIYHLWSMLLLGNVEVTQGLLVLINEATTISSAQLSSLIQTLPKPLMLWLVQEANEQRFPAMTEDNWCAALGRLSNSDNIMMMIEQIRYSGLLTPKVISSLCRFKLDCIVQLVLDSPAKTQNMILAAWKADPSQEQAKMLAPYSLTPDFRVLRSILHVHARHSNWQAVAWWLREYSNQKVVFPEALRSSLPAILAQQRVSLKLPKPEFGEPHDWRQVLNEALPEGIDRNIDPQI